MAPLMTKESQGCMTPVLGLTKYFLGEVVLTWQKVKYDKNESIKGQKRTSIRF